MALSCELRPCRRNPFPNLPQLLRWIGDIDEIRFSRDTLIPEFADRIGESLLFKRVEEALGEKHIARVSEVNCDVVKCPADDFNITTAFKHPFTEKMGISWLIITERITSIIVCEALVEQCHVAIEVIRETLLVHIDPYRRAALTHLWHTLRIVKSLSDIPPLQRQQMGRTLSRALGSDVKRVSQHLSILVALVQLELL